MVQATKFCKTNIKFCKTNISSLTEAMHSQTIVINDSRGKKHLVEH